MRVFDMITAQKIRDGDVDTFETLINSYKIKVFNYCLRINNNYHIAEEITQEVFIKVYQNIQSYDWQKAALSTWIFAIAHHNCLNNLRNNPIEAPFDTIEQNSSSFSTEEAYLTKELQDKLNAALQSLKPEDRSLILFKDYFGLKNHEISKIFNLPLGTVKSRLHSTRKILRELIGDYYD